MYRNQMMIMGAGLALVLSAGCTPPPQQTTGGAKACKRNVEIGKRVNEVQARAIQNKVHTKQYILQTFGAPSKRLTPASHPLGCTERWLWVWAKCVIGQRARSESMVVDFYPDGRVCVHAFARVPKTGASTGGAAPAPANNSTTPAPAPAGGNALD